MISRNALAPAPPDGTVDWVYLGRLVGRFTGPITRDATDAELAAAVAAGMSLTQLAGILHRSTHHLRARLARR